MKTTTNTADTMRIPSKTINAPDIEASNNFAHNHRYGF